ncbi:MAG: orotate phosphoribosyltransferase [Acutalibacteraceae bacterium]|jgi:orotate phosphoribosyltransferase|nr:orotate phosphoribosyltransferase [Clostridiales bacterium]
MITNERVTEVLKEAGVLLEGHFLLTSGRHSNKYLQCANIFRNTKYSEELCAALAEKYKDDDIQLIIGPAMGAVQMAYEVSRNFGCENFFTERDENGKMQLRRGFSIKPGQRVLVVEDVVTTGGSVREVVEYIQQNGGVVAGVGSIVDRTGGNIDFGVPFKAVYSVDVQSWYKDECPLCKEGKIELVKPGSRKIK